MSEISDSFTKPETGHECHQWLHPARGSWEEKDDTAVPERGQTPPPPAAGAGNGTSLRLIRRRAGRAMAIDRQTYTDGSSASEMRLCFRSMAPVWEVKIRCEQPRSTGKRSSLAHRNGLKIRAVWEDNHEDYQRQFIYTVNDKSNRKSRMNTHRLTLSAVILSSIAFFSTTPARAATFALGTSTLLRGPAAGSGSVVLSASAANAAWTATANSSWLHLNVASQSGVGSKNVIFTFDANPSLTRAGTLTIAGQTLTVTQAGSTYVSAPGPVTALVSTGLSHPFGVTLAGGSNVYIADTQNSVIKMWMPANNTVTTVVSSGFYFPQSVALDSAGNIYEAQTYHSEILKWTAASNTVTDLTSYGFNLPEDAVVDSAGNVYIADAGNWAIYKWTAANSNVTTLISTVAQSPWGVALDSANNVYIAGTGENTIKEWTVANSNLTTLVSSGLSGPHSVALDGAGNIYIADTYNNAIKEWTAANSNTYTLVSSGINQPFGVAVDGVGNVYIADTYNNAIKELPYAFVDPTPRLESAQAGTDSLPVVLPATANLLAPFLPTTDQSWLAISGITNGVISFSFTGNASLSSRAANILLLGQTIPVTQAGSILPTVVCPPDIITNQAIGECAQTVSFAPVVTGNPTPTLVCTANGNAITSPYAFPVGTNVVTCIASNIAGSQSCSFTVTVVDTNPPVTGPFSMGPQEGIPESVPITKMLLVDQSPSGSPLSIASVISPTINNGVVTLSGGFLTYTPALNYVGTDIVNYILTDGCRMVPGTVSVTVSSTNAPSQNGLTVQMSGSNAILQFHGIPGQSYYIQQASSITGPWTDLPGTPETANALGMIAYTVTNSTTSFYRTSINP